MRICIITSEFITEKNFDGGLANYNYKLASLLIAAGHEVAVIVGSDRTDELVYDGIPLYRIHVLDYDNFLFTNKFLCSSYSKLKRYLRKRTGIIMGVELRYQAKMLNRKFAELNAEKKFDIVHYSSLGGIGLQRPVSVPVISRISSSTIDCHRSGGYGDNEAAILKQQKLEFAALRKMDGIFGPSRMIANIIAREVKREIKIIESPFMFPGYDLDDSLYRQHLDGKKYLLFFGTIGLIKGCATIAEILADFFSKHPDYYFVFVGKVLRSPEENTDMLQYLKKKAGSFADRIIHFGKTPHKQLFPLINNSHFVVLPSRIDNFPNTCIEAMGSGKIVIGTRGNGFEQVIVDGENGFLVEVDNSRELLHAINKGISLSPDQLSEMEKKAVHRIQKLKPEIIADELTGFYSSVIKNFTAGKQ
jgi:glycogen synthase